MIIKNIAIIENDRAIRIEISDSKMSAKEKEIKTSISLDRILGEIVEHKDFIKIINK